MKVASQNAGGSRQAVGFVAVLGPPASGKSTLARWVTSVLPAVAFRLRDFSAQQAGHDPVLAWQLAASPDQLGWLPDAVVHDLLVAAFEQDRFPVGDAELVVLENFPGNVDQAASLMDVLWRARVALPARLGAIELVASDAVVGQRAAMRRACPGCEPDERGDPHLPAVESPERPGRCASCGAALRRRKGDAPAMLARRLVRFRDNIDAIRAAFFAEGIDIYRIDATAPLATVGPEAQRRCQRLLCGADETAVRELGPMHSLDVPACSRAEGAAAVVARREGPCPSLTQPARPFGRPT